jgi:hypothetical protein
MKIRFLTIDRKMSRTLGLRLHGKGKGKGLLFSLPAITKPVKASAEGISEEPLSAYSGSG